FSGSRTKPTPVTTTSHSTSAKVLRLLNRYSFGFAFTLLLLLLAIDLTKTPNFGWTEQLGTFAPLALAAMASTPAIISGGGGFDLSISPLMTFTSVAMVVWLA